MDGTIGRSFSLKIRKISESRALEVARLFCSRRWNNSNLKKKKKGNIFYTNLFSFYSCYNFLKFVNIYPSEGIALVYFFMRRCQERLIHPRFQHHCSSHAYSRTICSLFFTFNEVLFQEGKNLLIFSSMQI